MGHSVLSLAEPSSGLSLSLARIQSAYRKASRRCHPDKGGCRQAFEELQLAYRELLKCYGYRGRMVPEFDNSSPAAAPSRPSRAPSSNSVAQLVVRWEVRYGAKRRQSWWDIDANSMFEIERAFQMGEETCVYTWNSWKKQYLLTFRSMTQVNIAGGEEREVRRASIDTG